MASFPCVSCGALIEINARDYDVRCKKCGEKKPFKCSKCQRSLTLGDIYHPERLTNSRKPIFCEECGKGNDFVKCNQCTQSVVRADCIEKTVKGTQHFYHKKCYEDAISTQNKVFPIAAMTMAVAVGYGGYMVGYNADCKWLGMAIGAIIGIFVGKKISNCWAPK